MSHANVSALAGRPAGPSMLGNAPDPSATDQRVAFDSSGHRGAAFDKSFTQSHLLANSQTICQYRDQGKINGPFFLGMDTRALSVPPHAGALDVQTPNDVEAMPAEEDDYTRTPVISYSIPTYNRECTTELTDGLVITRSHHPLHDGGVKSNSPVGLAESRVTGWIEAGATTFLDAGRRRVKLMAFEKALRSSGTRRGMSRSSSTRLIRVGLHTLTCLTDWGIYEGHS